MKVSVGLNQKPPSMGIGFRDSFKCSLPGIALASLVWLATFTQLDYSGLVNGSYGLWQSLGSEYLVSDVFESLLSLHIQPPGLNLLSAVDLMLTPDTHLTLAALFLVMMISSIFMLVDTLRECGLRRRTTVGGGLLYATLPATVIYSLWPFSTAPTMFGSAMALWGVSLLRRRSLVGVAASCMGISVLFLTRASFTWLFILLWLALVALVVYRRRERGGKTLFHKNWHFGADRNFCPVNSSTLFHFFWACVIVIVDGRESS